MPIRVTIFVSDGIFHAIRSGQVEQYAANNPGSEQMVNALRDLLSTIEAPQNGQHVIAERETEFEWKDPHRPLILKITGLTGKVWEYVVIKDTELQDIVERVLKDEGLDCSKSYCLLRGGQAVHHYRAPVGANMGEDGFIDKVSDMGLRSGDELVLLHAIY